MALVSVDDLMAYMDVSFSPRQKIGVQFILDGLHSELEEYLRRPITVGNYEDFFYVAPGDSIDPNLSSFYEFGYAPLDTVSSYNPPVTLALKNTPVSSVTSVYVGRVGSASAAGVLQTENLDYVVKGYGIDILYGLSPFDSVHVTYSGGLHGEDINAFKLLILRAAAREASNLHDDNRGIQDLETRGATVNFTGFTEMELKSVKRRKRQRI